jgi:hypothetical protein
MFLLFVGFTASSEFTEILASQQYFDIFPPFTPFPLQRLLFTSTRWSFPVKYFISEAWVEEKYKAVLLFLSP